MSVMIKFTNTQTNLTDITFEPAHAIFVLIAYTTSEGSGAPAHPRSYARAFTARTHVVQHKAKAQAKN